mmetsp:Transcript_4065/g.7395  ORF Transcript_4065/g.7395 Transcript_4065/m.7395 type:complete len:209 (+) Transcript_4065:716-1342(+)
MILCHCHDSNVSEDLVLLGESLGHWFVNIADALVKVRGPDCFDLVLASCSSEASLQSDLCFQVWLNEKKVIQGCLAQHQLWDVRFPKSVQLLAIDGHEHAAGADLWLCFAHEAVPADLPDVHSLLAAICEAVQRLIRVHCGQAVSRRAEAKATPWRSVLLLQVKIDHRLHSKCRNDVVDVFTSSGTCKVHPQHLLSSIVQQRAATVPW